MARTTTEIEQALIAKENIMMLEYIKDYMSLINNQNVDKLNSLLQDIYNHINGLDRVVGHLGKPLDPASSDPLNANEYDWYFNTNTHEFKMFHNGSWTVIATLSGTVDLTDYLTKTEAASTYASIGDSYTKTETDKQNLNQHEINKKYLSEFSDNVFFKSDTVMEYKDVETDLVTLDASITTSGTTLTYSSLISPYDRINQDQASFEATLGVNGQSIEYLFTSKGKAIKFTGDKASFYKWETVTKFDANGNPVKYVKFSGNCVITIANNALSGTPTWVPQTSPYEALLSDFMDSSSGTAIVTMHFTTKPAHGTKVADIVYNTAPYFYDKRQVALRESQNKLNDTLFETKSFDFTGNDLTWTEQTQGGNNYIILDRPVLAGDTPINGLNKVKIQQPASPVANTSAQVTYGTDLLWIDKANTNIMNWNEIVNQVTADKIMVIKRLDNNNWQLVRWEDAAAVSLPKTLRVEFSDKSFEDFKVG